jgi:hypothetical protein
MLSKFIQHFFPPKSSFVIKEVNGKKHLVVVEDRQFNLKIEITPTTINPTTKTIFKISPKIRIY